MAAAPPLLTHFGGAHLAALAVTVVVGAGLVWAARSRCCPRALGCAEVVLSILLITSYPAKILARFASGIEINIDVLFPLHLCDLAVITAFFALVFRHPLMAELTYFWGLAATLQAVLTPSTCYDFPSPAFFVYFQMHSSVVITALYLPLGLGWRPRPGAVLRVWRWGLVYVAVAGAVDFIASANYGFIREKAEGSIMEILGPWPVYVFGMVALALFAFALLDLPFAGRRAGVRDTTE